MQNLVLSAYVCHECSLIKNFKLTSKLVFMLLGCCNILLLKSISMLLIEVHILLTCSSSAATLRVLCLMHIFEMCRVLEGSTRSWKQERHKTVSRNRCLYEGSDLINVSTSHISFFICVMFSSAWSDSISWRTKTQSCYRLCAESAWIGCVCWYSCWYWHGKRCLWWSEKTSHDRFVWFQPVLSPSTFPTDFLPNNSS